MEQGKQPKFGPVVVFLIDLRLQLITEYWMLPELKPAWLLNASPSLDRGP